VKVDPFNVNFRSLFDHLVKQTRWALSYLWASRCDARSVYCESWSLRHELLNLLFDHLAERARRAIDVLWKLITLTWAFVRCLITWSCCLWASQCDAWSVYVSVTCAYRAVTALSMRLFSFSDKHSLQKIRSQHLIQINLIVNLKMLVLRAKSSDLKA